MAGVVVAVVAVFAAPAAASDIQTWDGSSPFVCTLQQAGEGTHVRHPDADPYCVEYDETHQDVSHAGLGKFLVKEPARAAAAIDKCWYYQVDHWTGQIVAGDGSTETYRWDGAYFFDKRYGYAGVHVERFTIGRHSADPSRLPGFPAAWRSYFSSGRGGVVFHGGVNPDPNCLPHAGPSHSPYSNPPSYSGGAAFPHGPVARRVRAALCRRIGGAAHSGLGRARLGMSRGRLTRRLGRPVRQRHGFLHFCVRGGGDLAVHLDRHHRADFVVTTARSFHAGRARVHWRLRAAERAVRGERVLARRGRTRVLEVRHRRWRLFMGVRRGRVSFLAVSRHSLGRHRLGRLLAASH